MHWSVGREANLHMDCEHELVGVSGRRGLWALHLLTGCILYDLRDLRVLCLQIDDCSSLRHDHILFGQGNGSAITEGEDLMAL
jgi:hypothetical protein